MPRIKFKSKLSGSKQRHNKRMKRYFEDDVIQPYIKGKINPKFVRKHGKQALKEFKLK